jgi:hypothetical protein
MFWPLLPGGASRSIALGRGGWIGLLIVLGGLLAWFDTWSVRREQPRVTVPEAPGPQPGKPYLDDRRMLTEKLKFSLPAVDVRRPATMPGGTTMDSLASVAVQSGVQGSGLAAALMQAAASLQGQPRTYQVRMFTERCRPNGYLGTNGRKLRVTVEVRDARTGQSVAVQILRLCSPHDAAEKVAGFTARQVFRQDHSAPEWATGSLDGEDLSAYLLTRETCPAGGTFRDWWTCRQQRREKLAKVAWNGTAAGVVGFELAGMYDLDHQNLQSLLLHLNNRVHYPRFWRGRYRLAISLSMLTGPIFESHWLAADRAPGSGPGEKGRPPADVKDAIIEKMTLAGLLRGRTDSEISVLRSDSTERAAEAKLALLRLARTELRKCWVHRHASALLLAAFWHRPERGAALAALRGKPRWWAHPRRRLWSLVFALEIVRQRMRRLERQEGADEALRRAQRRTRRRLGIGQRGRRWTLRQGDRPWAYQRAPWQAVYNAACLHALPASSGRPEQADRPPADAASYAVKLLRLAISDPDCELDRPSEWIATDPGLLSLRSFRPFKDLVGEQAEKDFEPSLRSDVGDDPWFQARLPRESLLDSLAHNVPRPHVPRPLGHGGQRRGAGPPGPAGGRGEHDGHLIPAGSRR